MCIFCYLLKLLLLLFVNIVLCVAACNNAEYEINGECCPMCDPGKRVYKHCDQFTSTTCDSCRIRTYSDAPNGLTECLPCSVCDTSNGLRVKQACTVTSDTVCGPLPGYYCIDSLYNCKRAKKHSSCSPGQYINQTGTEFRDTVCDVCPAGSYSDGTLCKLHTDCESLGKTTISEGTDTTDAECRDRPTSHLLTVILSLCGVCLLMFPAITVIIVKKKIAKKQNSGSYQVTNTQDTNL
ncbi:tumor necrosis factor receptor superfamily member 14-like isoform X2 [Carassius carassius]|uniref:tumor necrosis factor receptor superfamily member 14-like isoform X2 n=1 Tax=Carassius carassius TaxID=217509 RepID=UPI0028690026|nr:tumor necrosis factor receptor superfamily member 14-like isoform X2 [Carassius carassius]